MTLFERHARFVGERTLDTGTGETITADQVVIAAGSRPTIPDVEGLEEVGYHTSNTVMRLEELPERLLILGGGFVAAEFAHVFGSFGTRVTIVNRSAGLLRSQDEEISRRFTEIAQTQWDLRLSAHVTRVERYDGGVRAYVSDGSTVEADVVLVAVGRISNSDGLDLDRAGVKVDDGGVVVVDDHQRTTAPGRVGAGRRGQHLPAQARLQPRGPGGAAQPAAPVRPGRHDHLTARRRPQRGLLRPADRQRRAHRAGCRGPGHRARRRPAGLQRHGVRLGHGGHHQLRQGASRTRGRD